MDTLVAIVIVDLVSLVDITARTFNYKLLYPERHRGTFYAKQCIW